MSRLSDATGINIDLMPIFSGIKAGVSQIVARAGQQPAAPQPQAAQAELIAGISNTTLLLAGAGLAVGVVVLMAVGGTRNADR